MVILGFGLSFNAYKVLLSHYVDLSLLVICVQFMQVFLILSIEVL
jgi:hypothetical protein